MNYNRSVQKRLWEGPFQLQPNAAPPPAPETATLNVYTHNLAETQVPVAASTHAQSWSHPGVALVKAWPPVADFVVPREVTLYSGAGFMGR